MPPIVAVVATLAAVAAAVAVASTASAAAGQMPKITRHCLQPSCQITFNKGKVLHFHF